MMSRWNRRSVLRGVLGGGAVGVALPLLDCFLDGNGQAFAAEKTRIPVRFGTWFWGLGMDKHIWVPKKTGAGYDLPEELKPIEGLTEHINVFSNYNVITDGRSNLCHYTGWVGVRTGTAPSGRADIPGPTIDVTVADAIGAGTRFRSIELAATGAPNDSYSARSADQVNPPEISAVEFYRRLFGPQFQDPNAPEFTPNPEIMVRKSVLSAISDQRQALMSDVGVADRERLDAYFTSLRELEQRIDLQLQRPAPAVACRLPTALADDVPIGLDSKLVSARHRAMTDLLVMALACNQTKVFNMLYSNSGSVVTRTGFDKTHHGVTHEELVDEKLGYQPNNRWFVVKAMEEWAYFVKALASVKEGDATLLDNTLVFAHSDQNFAKIHSIDGIPMMTAGRAGGRIKSGLHVDGAGSVSSQVGLTVQKVMGVNVSEWGTGSMATTKDVSQILV